MAEQRPTEVTFKFPGMNHHKRQKISDPQSPNPTSAGTSTCRSSWFERLAHNFRPTCALAHTIDVQPDFRYPLAYIIQSVQEHYRTLYSYQPPVSLFSVMYYCQSLVVATLLYHDLYSRRGMSRHAASFRPDVTRLWELRVPNFMAQILSHLCPTHDAHQPGLLYVPTLAGFSFYHDFGRLVPPAMFLVADSIVRNIIDPEDADPQEIRRRFYSSKLVSVAGRDYFVTNFLGGLYKDGEEVCDPSNWFSNRIEAYLRPRIEGGHPCHFSPPSYAQEKDMNPYEFMLGHSIMVNYDISQLLRSVSDFVLEEEPSSTCLGTLLSSPSGITIMSHFYSPPTLPTCHTLPPPPTAFKKQHVNLDSEQFASKVGFLATPSSETPKRLHFSPVRFDYYMNVCPRDVLGFQPYGQDLESLGVALTLGLTIENGDIEGVAVSQPNASVAPFENHDARQGSFPVSVIRAYIPNFDPDNKLVIYERAGSRRSSDNSRGFSRGMMVSCRNGDMEYRSEETLPIPDSSVYFWSSYRYTPGHSQEVFFYSTLIALYGNVASMTLCRPGW